MARYAHSYIGERRTRFLGIKLTPSEEAQLKTAARDAGVEVLSEYARALCLRHAPAGRVAAPQRHRDTRALLSELIAIGNNLNQLARLANTTKETPQLDELHRTTELLKVALARVIAL